MKTKSLHLILCLSVMITGCKKDIITSKLPIPVKYHENNRSIAAYPFDWEHTDVMPTPSGTTILAPWASGSNQEFSPDIAFDFKSSEGWSLVYNTFNTTSLSSPYFFALYNQYRGLLRFYEYLPANTPVPSSYINHGLQLSGSASSSMLNYIAQDVTDFTVNQTTNTQIENYQIVSTGAWYVSQYEIAYDPNLLNIQQTALNMIWKAQSVNISNISLNGNINGTVKTTPATPTSAFNVAASANSIAQSGVTALATTVLKSTKETTTAPAGTPSTTPENKSNFSNEIVTIIKSALTANIAGTVKGVFNLIFGGNSSNSNSINLTIKATVGLSGTSSETTGLWNPTLAIPGTANSQNATGYIPAYNSTMGVFNLTAQPTVNVIVAENAGDGLGSSSTTYTFSVDNTSFQTLINPVVSGSASVSISQEVVCINPPTNIIGYEAQVESVAGNAAYGQLNYFTTNYDGDDFTTYFHAVGVRFTIKVTPNNGAPSSTIIKTFYANPNFIYQ